MENNFYTDDGFEHFLKDATDNFKMYPSRKVWYSIYNDLHPSRKWPSLAVCLLLISAILFVGVSNNNSINKNTPSSFDGISVNAREVDVNQHSPESQAKKRNEYVSFNDKIKTAPGNKSPFTHDINLPGCEAAFDELNTETGNVISTNSNAGNSNFSTPYSKGGSSIEHKKMANGDAGKVLNNKALQVEADNDHDKNVAVHHIIAEDIFPAATNKITLSTEKNTVTNKNILSAEDKAWVEDYAFQNRPAISKLKSFGNMQYYATTSVGFRKLDRINDDGIYASNARQTLVSSNNAVDQQMNVNDQVTQKYAINLEFGAAILYNVTRRIRLKTGLQFNYTNYISIADRLSHPTQTSIVVNDDNGFSLEPKVSEFANSPNGDKDQKLNNTTFQLSVPVGADIKLAGKNKLKWYAGAAVQPTFVTGGTVFAISADTKNYVNEPSLLRNWNLNTAVETFLSYKTGSGVTINAGPQLRYQVFSTYNKQYNYTEKLYNLGLKLGVTKSF